MSNWQATKNKITVVTRKNFCEVDADGTLNEHDAKQHGEGDADEGSEELRAGWS